MNAAHKAGTAKQSKRALMLGWLPALLVLALFNSGAAPAVAPGAFSATGILVTVGASVRGAVEASAGIVQDVYTFYQITRLRDARAVNEIVPVVSPALISPAELKLCKAKTALPAVDKSRS